ncbi:MAG: hypothetical protein V7713_10820 [Marinobacter sp.]
MGVKGYVYTFWAKAMIRMVIGFVMIIFVVLVAITYEQSSGDSRTYANMLGGIVALIGIPGLVLVYVGWKARNYS